MAAQTQNLAVAPSSQTSEPLNSNRRRGWVIASEDEQALPVVRPSNFDARRSAAAWNQGKGPSPASIPSRASSLTPSPTPVPLSPVPSSSAVPPAPMQQIQQTPTTPLPLPVQSLPKRQLHSSMATDSEPEPLAANGKRRPSPPLLVPPKQTYRKSPSVKVLPPSAYTDHKRMMAGLGVANRPAKPASPSAARMTFATATASTSASPISVSDRTSVSRQPVTSGATSSSAQDAVAVPTSPSYKGKERARDVPDLQAVKFDSAVPHWTHPTLLQNVNPMTPVSERSFTSENEHIAPSTSDPPLLPPIRKNTDNFRIELPPSRTQPANPAILVDSSHVTGDQPKVPPRRRRSTGSAASGLENRDDETGDDDDGNSSWPSTPSTTPLDYYFSDAAVAKAASKNQHQQTTTQLVSADSHAHSMGMPMVVVTSPSTASEVSSERRSSASSTSPSDGSANTVTSTTPANVLADVAEEPEASPSGEQATSKAPTSPEEHSATSKSPSKYNFFSKIASNKATQQPHTVVPVPNAKDVSVDVKRQPEVTRRSVELKPILLHSAAKQPHPTVDGATLPSVTPTVAASKEEKQQRRHSGRVAVRSNVVPYHSRRDSEASATSSTASLEPVKRVSLDRSAFDPRFSPVSHVSTAITVPSPIVKTKRVPPVKPIMVASASQNRFAASMPSLHQAPEETFRQTVGPEPLSPSAIRQLIDSQKGVTAQDNESIAEWISVSHQDVPVAQTGFGNGGVGEFSNQEKKPAKRLSQGKPWKNGRFAKSEAALKPAVDIAPQKHVRIASNTSGQTSGPPSVLPALGFTTASRNAVLQHLYAGRSILALAAGSVSVASMGRVCVPSSARLAQLKAEAKKQAKADKKAKNTVKPSVAAVPIEKPVAKIVLPQEKLEEDQVRVNVSGNRHSIYDIQNGVGTVNSMMPELGDWTDPTTSTDSAVVASTPFRDYEDDDSDLYSSSSDSEDNDWEGEDEDVEVPVRLGQRSKEPEMLNVFFSSLRSSKVAERDAPMAPNFGQKHGGRTGLEASALVARSPSLANVAPGSVEHKGKEIRICVEEQDGSSIDTTAIWKAVMVADLANSTCNDHGYLELKRQRQARQNRTRAMKLESDVSRGVFASFVGNNSPARMAKRSSADLTRSPPPGRRDQISSSDSTAIQANATLDEELFITKEYEDAYVVRQINTQEDQVLEIVRRSNTGSWISPQSPNLDSPKLKFDKAFPSPFRGSDSTSFTNVRPARRQDSSATTDSMWTSEEEGSRRVLLRVQLDDMSGFKATFTAHDGSTWVWVARSVPADTTALETADAGLVDTLNGFDLHLYTSVDANTVELASYTTESQLRSALGLFVPRGKRAPKPLPENESDIRPPSAMIATQVSPLGTPAFGGSQIRVDAAPRRGIRGGPLLRHQASVGAGIGAPGSAAWKQRQWQNQRAAVSTESVVQVHNNAVTNARSSLLIEGRDRKATSDATLAQAANAPPAGANQSKRKGELRFQPECQDRDLAVVSLLALLGMVKPSSIAL